MAPSQPSLGLSSLQSFSPSWSPDLRLVTCIATKYAAQRCVERINALTGANGGPDSEERTRNEFADQWNEYSEKFVTATCQHLGIDPQTLPPGNNNLDEILTAAQGRIIDPDDDADAETAQTDEDPYETGSAHTRAHPDHSTESTDAEKQPEPELADEQLPSGSLSGDEEKARASLQGGQPAREGRESQIELDPVSKSSLDSLDAPGSEVDEALPEYMRTQARLSASTSTATSDAGDEPESPAKAAANAPRKAFKRSGGALEPGREIEVVHELLLIALGLGQYRAEDGATTLWEQEALFGDALPPMDAPSTVSEGKSVKRDPTPKIDTYEVKPETREGKAPQGVPQVGAQVADGATKAWGSLKAGATSFGSLVSGNKSSTSTSGSSANHQNESTEKAKESKNAKSPVKPNEVCHYDARARALIAVAVMSMGVGGAQVFMAEKVVAQTIYFIMSESRRASSSSGSDPLASLPAGASLDPKTGAIIQPTEDSSSSSEGSRRAWMNSASRHAIAREAGKGNWGKWAATGAGFVLGGVAIGLTGGLAAPVLVPALAGLTGAGFLATSGGVVLVGTLFGLGGGGLAGYRVRRRLRGVDSFEFEELPNAAREAGLNIPSLHATICVSGLLLEPQEQIEPWAAGLGNTKDGRDAFAVRCETDLFVEAGKGLRSYVLDQLLRTGGQKAAEQVLKHTAFAAFAAITLPLTVMSAAGATLDGVFVRAKAKAHRAGLVLADTLAREVQGHRPVILIGTSLGCATILSALLELSKDASAHAHLIDSVILISAPLTPSPNTWRAARSVVARRFVNVHCSGDMVCRIAAWLGSGLSVEEVRAGRMPTVAGSRAVIGVPGLENVDGSDLLGSHFEVNDPAKLREVLQRVGMDE